MYYVSNILPMNQAKQNFRDLPPLIQENTYMGKHIHHLKDNEN